jgi:UDP-N-acetylglucosamine:LPS N-acetylglucosamine transferase
MNILITNDDGLGSYGLHALRQAIRATYKEARQVVITTELHEMKRRMDGLKKVNLRVRDFTAITYAELERIARRHKLELVPTDDAIDLTGDLDPDEPGPGLPFHDD